METAAVVEAFDVGAADLEDAATAGALADGVAAFGAVMVGAAAVEVPVVGAAGAGAPAVELTTVVDDLTSVVVQLPDDALLPDGAPMLPDDVALDEGAAALAGADATLGEPEDTFDPIGTTGAVGGGCLAGVVVALGSVVSGRTAPAFAALRTLSVGRAGEADRAVASRTCSIIAE